MAQIAALKGHRGRRRHGAFRQGRQPAQIPEVLRVNPKRQVLVLIDGEVEVFDSTQIFEYLEDKVPAPPLWPRDVAGRARARPRQIEHLSNGRPGPL